MTEEIAIKVENVSKNFVLPHEKITSIKSAFTGLYKRKNKTRESQHALKDISFEVKKGEFFGIVGRNGSGKSTMLKILAGIYQPTKGTVHTRGKLVPFIELGVGFNPELTGRENVFLNGAMLGFSRKEVAEMYDDIVAFAELERFMDQKLKNYSSGMQVRLAFSMATRAEADILLVDEVLAVGDADFQRKCFTFFKELKRQKKTIIFVSHDMNSVREYCDRALLIDNSEVIYQGTPTKAAAEYSKLFLNVEGSEKHLGQERWGDGTIEIKRPTCIVTEGNIELMFTVHASQDIDDLVLGYSVADGAGRQICGSNTQLLASKIKPLKRNDQYDAVFNTDNVLADGTYSLTLAALRNSGSVVADWWVNPTELVIKKPQHIPFIVDIPVSFSFDKEH